MKRGLIVVTGSLALMASLALAPAASRAGAMSAHAVGGAQAIGGQPVVASQHGFVGGRPGVSPRVGTAHSFGRPFSHPQPFFPRHHFHHRHFFRGFAAFPVLTSSVLVYAPSPLYDPAASYAPSPVIYNVYSPAVEVYNAPPAPAYAPPEGGPVSVAPSPPSVVEYETGRYELRGDGMTAPYTWVWIPNPPSGPPGAPAVGEPSAGRHGQVYRWTDDQGVTHVTDRWQAVPPRYRPQAKQNQPS